MTQRLLAFAKRQTLQVSVIDVGELLTGLREMLQRTLGEDIDVVFRIESGLWSCKVDAGQLEQAVINLANNARDAMPLGGRLLLEVANDSVDEEKAARVDGADPGDYVTISITDDGCGISPRAMQQSFEPFFTTKPTASGTGLGLSMVYGFVSQSSGHIVVDSTVGKGTRISFSLPRHRSEPVEPQPSAGALTVGAGEVVLIVDDDPDVCEMVRRVVSNLGYASLMARTGQEALDLLRQQGSVDLLLADVILAGGMSGVDLATEALQIFPRLKVLYMSGYAGDELARRIEVGDEVTLIQKPFRPEELGNHLREVFSD